MTDPPDDLPEHKAAAWTVLAAGGTYAAAAEAAGVAKGTVSKWKRQWRTELGQPDLFEDEATAERAAKTAAAREAADEMWTDLRVREARQMGVTAMAIRRTLHALLTTVGTTWVDREDPERPVRLSGPSGADIRNLAEAAARIIEVAELLEDRPTRHTRSSVPADQYVPPVPAAPELTDEERRAKVFDLAQRLRARKEDTG